MRIFLLIGILAAVVFVAYGFQQPDGTCAGPICKGFLTRPVVQAPAPTTTTTTQQPATKPAAKPAAKPAVTSEKQALCKEGEQCGTGGGELD